ncbi:MAG: type II toxin-antitoxin system HicB family antitoxin [Candidatus Poribacteria bacterium]|nr:type II toxin-antitoxin system HicB family antitoxin [Candidatus Poribacteria bacterium]
MSSPVYTAVIKNEGNWWIGWVQEIPGVNCQEATREELIDTLQTTLREFIEDDLAALSALGEYEKVPIKL